jgi:hypothetical protein
MEFTRNHTDGKKKIPTEKLRKIHQKFSVAILFNK